ASAAVQDDTVPRPAPRGPLATPVAVEEPRGMIGPAGAIGPEVYRKRRRALMDAIGTGAALVTQEMRWDSSRSGMDLYYLTGIEEPGAALLVAPKDPWTEQLFLSTRNEERDRVTGERAMLPSKELEVSTGIARIGRDRGLPFALLDACDHAGG